MNSPTLVTLGLSGWTPIRFFWSYGEPCVDWARLPAEPFREPFFEQSVGQAMCNPARMLFRRQTSADVLEAIGWDVADGGAGVPSVGLDSMIRGERTMPQSTTETSPHRRNGRATVGTPAGAGAIVPPAGLVFHVSRCGSTLICQMLAALSRNLVLSEPSPVDQVLTAHFVDPRVTRARRIAWLRGLVAALCQPRTGQERHAFIKFECLSVLDHELIAEAFPEVPRIFLYRDPVEVLVSLQRSLPAQMLPGVTDPRRLGIAPAFPPEQSLEEYIAQLLASVFTAKLAGAAEAGAKLVNFSELPSALWAQHDGLFPIKWTADELAHMRAAAQRDAKNPNQAHADDRAAKQRAAGDEIRRPAQRWLIPLYEQLEIRRLAQRGEHERGRGGLGVASGASMQAGANRKVMPSADIGAITPADETNLSSAVFHSGMRCDPQP